MQATAVGTAIGSQLNSRSIAAQTTDIKDMVDVDTAERILAEALSSTSIIEMLNASTAAYVQHADASCGAVKYFAVQGVSSPNPAFFTNLPSTARTAYYTNPQHVATARLPQGKLWSTYESCEAVPHHLTVAWHSRRAAWMLHQRVDCTDAVGRCR